MPRIERALISVYDKTGVVEFARTLKDLEIEIISTGGTARHLQNHGIDTVSISDITGFPEILSGRVKTLHPRVFGALLALRDDVSQMQEGSAHGLGLIDLVVVNLYPFEQTIAQPGVEMLQALEHIDIGGPSMIRAGAKNYLHVAVVTAPEQYPAVLAELDANGGEMTLATRRQLAACAFARTSSYDAAIHHYLAEPVTSEPWLADTIELELEKVQDLRYGENPHQRSALFRQKGEPATGLPGAKQIHGKELSYNNFIDADAALGIVQEFTEPCVVIIKHTNPCGVATGRSLRQAYVTAKATDPVSAFGGIVGVNRPVDEETARVIAEVFTEVVVAPGFTSGALEILQAKKNLRLLEVSDVAQPRVREFEVKRVQGGVLLQDQDFMNINDIELKVVSKRQPGAEEWTALKFGWRVCKWVKSNAIVYSKTDRTIGIGAGQMSRVDASRLAVDKAKRMGLELKDTVMASDAFFPFRDGIEVAAEVGATAIIQPGGSVRDQEVIQAADERQMAMVFTGVRQFRHS
ncbi:MAG: bifunctional phosphoribosylaminoimidazolecarboxamide formyltransferase/IMP cyclohydrolase [bacterium]